MQFNLVLVSNKQAVSLWTKLGFDTVGKIPKAFDHPKIGYVDALVMHKWLRLLIDTYNLKNKFSLKLP